MYRPFPVFKPMNLQITLPCSSASYLEHRTTKFQFAMLFDLCIASASTIVCIWHPAATDGSRFIHFYWYDIYGFAKISATSNFEASTCLMTCHLIAAKNANTGICPKDTATPAVNTGLDALSLSSIKQDPFVRRNAFSRARKSLIVIKSISSNQSLSFA